MNTQHIFAYAAVSFSAFFLLSFEFYLSSIDSNRAAVERQTPATTHTPFSSYLMANLFPIH